MRRRATRIATGTFALIVLSSFLPRPLADVHAAQPPPPFPIPITNREPYGDSEQIELGGGRLKLVTRNAIGQIISEAEFDGPKSTVTLIESVYPGGQPAEVMIIRRDAPLDKGQFEVVRYDSSGVPQEKEIREGDGDTRRERWNPKSNQWETAPERQRWDPYTGKWETVPENERFNAKLGVWQRLSPATGQWEAMPQTAEDILPELSPGGRVIAAASPSVPLQSSAKRGHAVAAEALAGLSTTIFSTPQGRLRVNLPDDMAAGDTISATIFAEPTGKDEREQARNLRDLRRYVVELENQKTPASSASPASGTPFTVAIGTTATPRLILRDKDGDEVARRELQVVRPSPAAGFEFPTLGQQGSPIAIGGPFDGDFKSSSVKVGGEVLQALAESPRKIVAHNTTSRVGLSACEVTEGSQTASGEIRTIGITLSAPKLDLLRGEQTTLTVTVTGLEGIQEPVPLVLQNMSPGIAQMSGGELQRLSIGPSQAQAGTYTTERTLTGIQRGTFTIFGTVAIAADPLKSQTRADLAITKTAVAVVPRQGFTDAGIEYARPGSIIYTITVTNNGRNGAESVVVTDTLPPQLTQVSCAANATQRDERGAGGTGVCGGGGNTRRITFPFLAVGATATITIVASVDPSAASGPLTNTAEVASATPDPDLSNNRATVTSQIPATTVTSTPRPPSLKDPPPPPPPPAADLQITKRAIPTVVKAGDRISYTIVVTNGGPATAAAPLILDSVPIETTFVACKATAGACKFGVAAGGLVDVALPQMPNGAIETVTVDVDVKKTVGPGTAIINDAEVSSATPDPNPGNNKATAIVWVRAPIPLVVISEFRTRGPRGEKDEFIELYNRSNQRLDLGGWTLAVSNGSGTTTTLLTIAPGTLLPARSHLLLANGDGYSGSVPGDQRFTGDIADEGGISLQPLRGVPGDEVGMSNGSAFREGAPLTPMLTNADQSYERRPGGASGSTVDSNNNRSDFRTLTPSDPQNLAGAPVSGRSPGVR